MKKENGITMISLVVTIVILALISTVTIKISVETYQVVKIENFIAKMKVIQGKVDNLAEENKDISSYGFVNLTSLLAENEEIYNNFSSMLHNPDVYNIDTGNSWNEELDQNPANYYYFTPQNLEQFFDLKDQDLTVIINFKTRNVIAQRGIKKNRIILL